MFLRHTIKKALKRGNYTYKKVGKFRVPNKIYLTSHGTLEIPQSDGIKPKIAKAEGLVFLNGIPDYNLPQILDNSYVHHFLVTGGRGKYDTPEKEYLNHVPIYLNSMVQLTDSGLIIINVNDINIVESEKFLRNMKLRITERNGIVWGEYLGEIKRVISLDEKGDYTLYGDFYVTNYINYYGELGKGSDAIVKRLDKIVDNQSGNVLYEK